MKSHLMYHILHVWAMGNWKWTFDPYNKNQNIKLEFYLLSRSQQTWFSSFMSKEFKITLILIFKRKSWYFKIKERGIIDPSNNMEYKGQNDSYRYANNIVCPKIYTGTQRFPSTSYYIYQSIQFKTISRSAEIYEKGYQPHITPWMASITIEVASSGSMLEMQSTTSPSLL